MDTAKRIAAVRDKLRELQKDEELARRAGPPCSGCIHAEGGKCGHLAYAVRSFSPETGKTIEVIDVAVAIARQPDGLCGPEGLLYERQRWLPDWSNLVEWVFGSLFPYFACVAVGTVFATVFVLHYADSICR